MSANFTGIMRGYHDFMETKSDPRTRDWFLIGSPGVVITILVSYLYFCTSAGPRYMKNRKPYDLKFTMMMYNMGQVVVSTWLVWEGLQAGWLNDYSYKCQPVDYSLSPNALRMARAVWCYFLVKLIELLDTVFFVLRKKERQVSYLHLWHHTLMPVCAWIGCRFLPGGHGTFLGLVNSFVHIIMYGYYLFAGLGPQYQKYLWWKKYLTTLQMVQFVVVFFHSMQLLLYDCNYPKAIVVLLGINALYFLYLFASFYRRTYRKSKLN